MKYISLIVFAALMIWTWTIVHNSPDLSFETHSGIQEKLAVLISDTIKAKRPSASEILIQKIWTESIGDNKVKAFFAYTFKDIGESGPITSEIKGEGILERQGDDGSGNDRWSLTKVHTTSDAIQFDDATIITGSASGSPEPETPPSGEHPTSEPPAESHQ